MESNGEKGLCHFFAKICENELNWTNSKRVRKN